VRKIFQIIVIVILLLGCSDKSTEPIVNEPKNPMLELLTPNGNEIFTSGQIINIFWESSDIKEFDIDISYDDGTTWHLVAERLDSPSKSFNYTPIDTCSYYCLIKIKDSENSGLSDTSDSTFTIIDINEAKKYYQLQIGNIWVYEKNNGSNISYEKREILGDTTINNRTYFKMSINISPNYFKYFRVSEHGDFIEYRADKEFVILDFSSPPGRYQISEAVVIIRGDTSKTFFIKLYSVKWQYFQYGSGFGNETYDEFANGLGKTFEHFASLSSFTDYALKGAVINQILYGDTSTINLIGR